MTHSPSSRRDSSTFPFLYPCKAGMTSKDEWTSCYSLSKIRFFYAESRKSSFSTAGNGLSVSTVSAQKSTSFRTTSPFSSPERKSTFLRATYIYIIILLNDTMDSLLFSHNVSVKPYFVRTILGKVLGFRKKIRGLKTSAATARGRRMERNRLRR